MGSVRALRIGLAGWALVLYVVVIAVPSATTGSLGRWNTDHYAHVGASILFWHRGLDVFARRSTTSARPRRRREGLAVRPGLACPTTLRSTGARGRATALINWQACPRPYPPGALVTRARALLYAHTSLSRTRSIASRSSRTSSSATCSSSCCSVSSGPRRRVARAGAASPCWSRRSCTSRRPDGRRRGSTTALDPVPVLGDLSAPPGRTGRRARLPPLAAFLHFRAIWYVPLGIVTLASLRSPSCAAARGAAGRRGPAARTRGRARARARGPYLAEFRPPNPIISRTSRAPHRSISSAVVLVGRSSLLQRQWLLAALVGWQGVVIGFSVQTQFWHPMFLLPLLAVARWKRAKWPTLAALVLLIAGVARIVYKTRPMIAAFASDVIHRTV